MSTTSADNPKRPTMRDVGERAGVSFKTVSRVVNGEAGVSPELAARVRAAVADLGYRPDQAASTLRRGDRRTSTVAAVLTDLGNPFSSAVHRAIVDTARERDVVVLAASSDEETGREREAIAAFSARRVDGLLIMPTDADHAWLEAERRRGVAIVAVDRPASGIEIDTVDSDNREGTARAVSQLIRRGHRRIGYLGDLHTIHTARERLAGYEHALRAGGIDVDPDLIRLDLRGSAPAEAASIELLTAADPPTAIFAGQNRLTIGAVHALRQLGLHRDIALIGFDDIELGDLLDPGVTVVAQDAPEIGRVAAEQLFSRIDGDRSPVRRHVVPTRLVPRGSGEIAPRD
jgi:LacI family transcriptional regulator